jgi:AraC-like DNA-binding protein/CheY-like chemotaxis protein
MIGVLVAEDEPRILANIVKKIEASDPGFRVVATAANGREALEKAQALTPDVVVTDIVMPLMSGLDMVAALKGSVPGVQVVIVSGYGEFPYAQRAISLGVTDYLLKPLRPADVAATLRRLRERLSRQADLLTLEDLAPGDQAGGSLLYTACLVSIGNACAPGTRHPPEHLQRLDSLWRGDHHVAALERTGLRHRRLWRLRQSTPNVALLVACVESRARVSNAAIAEEILAGFCGPAAPYAVTVCTSAPRTARAGLGDRVAALHAALGRGLCIGVPQVLVAEDVLSREVPPALLPPETENELGVAAVRGDTALAARVVEERLRTWLEARCPQVRVVQAVGHLMRVIQSALPSVTETAILAAEEAAAQTVACAPGAGDLLRALPPMLAALLAEAAPLGGDRVADLVCEYLEKNYARPVSLADLSRRLGYEESHITRLFKHRKGEPPIRYLTRLRMERARGLLRDRPELDVGEVGRIVGYPDQHYFCRVFRKTTGRSPTDYRLA